MTHEILQVIVIIALSKGFCACTQDINEGKVEIMSGHITRRDCRISCSSNPEILTSKKPQVENLNIASTLMLPKDGGAFLGLDANQGVQSEQPNEDNEQILLLFNWEDDDKNPIDINLIQLQTICQKYKNLGDIQRNSIAEKLGNSFDSLIKDAYTFSSFMIDTKRDALRYLIKTLTLDVVFASLQEESSKKYKGLKMHCKSVEKECQRLYYTAKNCHLIAEGIGERYFSVIFSNILGFFVNLEDSEFRNGETCVTSNS